MWRPTRGVSRCSALRRVAEHELYGVVPEGEGTGMGMQHGGTIEGMSPNANAAAQPRACSSGAHRAWRSTIGLCLALSVGALSLLLWSKLKLVTNVPRTAYAVPEERDQGASDTGGEDRGERSDDAPRSAPRRP